METIHRGKVIVDREDVGIMAQLDLFGKKVTWNKYSSEKWKQHMQEVEEHNQRCAEKREETRSRGENETGLGGTSFPCPLARQFPVGKMRKQHIENCDECKQLERKLDESIGVTNHVYS